MSIIGVTLGVMILFVVNSVMDGFQSKICSKLVNTHGDIRVDSDEIISDSDRILKFLKNENNIAAASSYIMGLLMMQFEDRQAYPLSKGVDVRDEKRVVPLDEYIVAGDLANFDDDAVVIGASLADRLGIKAGDTVDIYSPLILQDLQDDELVLPKSFIVVAIYLSEWNQVDANFLMLTKHAMEGL